MAFLNSGPTSQGVAFIHEEVARVARFLPLQEGQSFWVKAKASVSGACYALLEALALSCQPGFWLFRKPKGYWHTNQALGIPRN